MEEPSVDSTVQPFDLHSDIIERVNSSFDIQKPVIILCCAQIKHWILQSAAWPTPEKTLYYIGNQCNSCLVAHPRVHWIWPGVSRIKGISMPIVLEWPGTPALLREVIAPLMLCTQIRLYIFSEELDALLDEFINNSDSIIIDLRRITP